MIRATALPFTAALLLSAALLPANSVLAQGAQQAVVNCNIRVCPKVTGSEPPNVLTKSGRPLSTYPKGTTYTVIDGQVIVLKPAPAGIAAPGAKPATGSGSGSVASGGGSAAGGAAAGAGAGTAASGTFLSTTLIGGLSAGTGIALLSGAAIIAATASGGGDSNPQGATGTTGTTN